MDRHVCHAVYQEPRTFKFSSQFESLHLTVKTFHEICLIITSSRAAKDVSAAPVFASKDHKNTALGGFPTHSRLITHMKRAPVMSSMVAATKPIPLLRF